MFHRMTSRYTAEGGTAVEKSRKGTKKERRTRQGAQRERKGQDARKQRNSIMRHRSASPAKSQAFPQLGKAEPARFLGGKITAGNFLPKTRRA